MTAMTQTEQETALYQNAANRTQWEMYTDDPVWQRRLRAINAELVRAHPGGGETWRLRADQVVVRKGKRAVALSDARRAALALGRQRRAAALDTVQGETT